MFPESYNSELLEFFLTCAVITAEAETEMFSNKQEKISLFHLIILMNILTYFACCCIQ